MGLEQAREHHAQRLRTHAQDDAQAFERLSCLLRIVHQGGEHRGHDAVDSATASTAEQHGKCRARRLENITSSGHI